MSNPASSGWFSDYAQIADDGERVTHLQKDYVYYGHLAVYRFAVPLCQGLDVLDAGCGAGYGASYLMEHGACSVTGVDASAKAIAFCRHHFDRPGLTYQAMDLEKLTFPPAAFDFIFSSNVLEHVPNVWAFFDGSHRVLKPGGSLFLAVPPITNDYEEYMNLVNPYHVNIWSPRQWDFVLRQYFADVACYRYVDPLPVEQRLAESASLDETIFEFQPCSLDEMYAQPTMGALFLACQARQTADLPRGPGDHIMIDASYTRPAGVIDPARRQRLQSYFTSIPANPGLLQRARERYRQQGALPTLHAALRWLRRRAVNAWYEIRR